MNKITRKMVSITLLMLLTAGVVAAVDNDINPDADVNVTVNAPEYVSDTFEVTIDVTEVSAIIGAQFDLTFDPDVLNIDNTKTDVTSGMIDDIELPISSRRLLDDGRIRILIYDANLIEEGGASGSGYIAKIIFAVVGATGDNSAIDFCESDESTRKLTDVDAETIDANWFGTNVTIGTAPSTPAETPTPTHTETPAVNVTPELESTSVPTPTATPVETESLELSSKLFAMTASAESAPDAAVPDASSKSNGLPNIPTSRDLIPIYSLVGLFALIYAIIQFK